MDEEEAKKKIRKKFFVIPHCYRRGSIFAGGWKI
jgi:hypothetical protein